MSLHAWHADGRAEWVSHQRSCTMLSVWCFEKWAWPTGHVTALDQSKFRTQNASIYTTTFLLLAHLLLCCSVRLCSRSSTIHVQHSHRLSYHYHRHLYAHDTQLFFSFHHPTLTQTLLNFKTLFTGSLPGWLQILYLSTTASPCLWNQAHVSFLTAVYPVPTHLFLVRSHHLAVLILQSRHLSIFTPHLKTTLSQILLTADSHHDWLHPTIHLNRFFWARSVSVFSLLFLIFCCSWFNVVHQAERLSDFSAVIFSFVSYCKD